MVGAREKKGGGFRAPGRVQDKHLEGLQVGFTGKGELRLQAEGKGRGNSEETDGGTVRKTFALRPPQNPLAFEKGGTGSEREAYGKNLQGGRASNKNPEGKEKRERRQDAPPFADGAEPNLVHGFRPRPAGDGTEIEDSERGGRLEQGLRGTIGFFLDYGGRIG